MPVYEATVRLSATGVAAFEEAHLALADSSPAAGEAVLQERLAFYSDRDALVYAGTVVRVRSMSTYNTYKAIIYSVDDAGKRYQDIIIAPARNRGDAISLFQTEFGAVFRNRTIESYTVEEHPSADIRLDTRWGRGL